MTSEPYTRPSAEDVQLLLQSRQTTLPKRLGSPGPDDQQLQALFRAAAAAPDHGQIQPWRLVIIPVEQRPRLADVFGQALLDRDASASAGEVAQAREKAFRAPVLLLVVIDSEKGDPSVDVHERSLAAGCAVQNMLLLATAMGFGTALTSGKALKSGLLRAAFALRPSEFAPCFVSIGTASARKPTPSRPAPCELVSTWGEPSITHSSGSPV